MADEQRSPAHLPPGDYAAQQQINSATRTADGQCSACGAFRLDGLPPTVHRTGCVAPDRLPVAAVVEPNTPGGVASDHED